MQKTFLVLVLFAALSFSAFAQVEEAVRYRTNHDVVVIEQQTSVSSFNETSSGVILQNRSNSQLEELGSRWGWVRSNSQLDELGSRWGWVRSNSQLDELGSRWGWVRSNSQLDELGSRWGWVR